MTTLTLRRYARPIAAQAPLTRIDNRYITKEERSIINFATFQLFSLLYLEKFAIGPATFQLTIPLLTYAFGFAWMIMLGRMGVDKYRLSLFLLMVGCCVFSSVMANSAGSIPSMGQLFLVYAFFTASAPLPMRAYQTVLNRFIMLMILPAIIGLVQYGIQAVTGGGDPISMTNLVPQQFQVQGFFYEAHYPIFSSPFQRPNGFFFLEPSFFSFFTASAAVVEITYFRRPWVIILMVAATLLSFGGTGAAILGLASPFLLLRENPRLMLPLGVAVLVGLVVAFLLGVPLPLISRMNELDTGGVGGGGSGMLRLTLPFDYLIDRLSDPAYLFTGNGPGSTGATFGATSAWPILKMINEYGLVSTLVYVVLFMSLFTISSLNLALKFAMIIIFHFTGGYLVDGISIQFFFIMFAIEPTRQSPE
jgi:hypothetical protein